MRRHRQRDIYLMLTAASLGLAATAMALGAPWAFVVAGLLVVFAAYLLAALMLDWPLPGGFDGGVTPTDSDETIGRECLVLAQAMWDLIANSQRDEPGGVTQHLRRNGMDIPEAIDAAWQAADAARHAHESKLMAQFWERFGVRLSGVVQELLTRDQITDAEARSLWFSSGSVHMLGDVPRLLAMKGRQLGARPT